MSEESEVEVKRTPTTVLIEAMEAFSIDEPLDILIIVKHQSGDISWTGCSPFISDKLGLVKFAEICLEDHVREGMRDSS